VVNGQVRVGVLGARGKVGSEVCAAVEAAEDLELVARIDVDDPIESLVETSADAVVDFTHPDVVMDSLRFLVEHGIHIIETLDLEELAARRATEFVAVVAPLAIVGATGSPVRPLAILG